MARHVLDRVSLSRALETHASEAGLAHVEVQLRLPDGRFYYFTSNAEFPLAEAAALAKYMREEG